MHSQNSDECSTHERPKRDDIHHLGARHCSRVARRRCRSCHQQCSLQQQFRVQSPRRIAAAAMSECVFLWDVWRFIDASTTIDERVLQEIPWVAPHILGLSRKALTKADRVFFHNTWITTAAFRVVGPVGKCLNLLLFRVRSRVLATPFLWSQKTCRKGDRYWRRRSESRSRKQELRAADPAKSRGWCLACGFTNCLVRAACHV